MRENQSGWWERSAADYRNRQLTKDDLSAINALIEFDYLKKEDVLLPEDATKIA